MIAASKNISSTDTLTAAVSPVKVLMAAGGTGGHVYPAISIARAILDRQPEAEILFVGTKDRMEWQAVPKAGFKIKSIWISGFHRRLAIQNLLFPLKLFISLVQSLIIILKFRPDALIACGGFAAGPAGWVASKLGIPVILQEQNSYPGVTNRLLSKNASIIYTAFEDAAEYMDDKKITLSGNPVRKELSETDKDEALGKFNFSPNKKTLLIIGGSGGAKSINEAMTRHVKRLHDELELQIIWQCGEKYLDEIEKRIEPNQYKNLRLTAYIDNMPSAYAAADLVISRAGAGSCSELMVTGKPSILVPSPNVAGDHQKKNAESMVKNRASELLEDRNVNEKLFEAVESLITDPEKLAGMTEAAKDMAKPDAADRIATEVIKLINSHKKN